MAGTDERRRQVVVFAHWLPREDDARLVDSRPVGEVCAVVQELEAVGVRVDPQDPDVGRVRIEAVKSSTELLRCFNAQCLWINHGLYVPGGSGRGSRSSSSCAIDSSTFT
ncbi:hypothetical protein Mvan_4353 [Mycolicibacterium vanbaalenii PYR-1]|uniref:Uncharacterized protein n=1 Tax=Mycolicibacterium vanbaalenii (strain DSM 7251 / JCM 13017 / BCRC 16820 / KCTC 9966 / NRRL B-24157 / PYR-1) TaxID=350058 RepID=A1TD80_MYCVP|nr:hypothetical protein Mvan_4353 [Mycolicibacterium vanbaalenii PYR-1]